MSPGHLTFHQPTLLTHPHPSEPLSVSSRPGLPPGPDTHPERLLFLFLRQLLLSNQSPQSVWGALSSKTSPSNAWEAHFIKKTFFKNSTHVHTHTHTCHLLSNIKFGEEKSTLRRQHVALFILSELTALYLISLFVYAILAFQLTK